MQRTHRRLLLAASAMGLGVSVFCGPVVPQSEIFPVQRPVAIDWLSVARDVRALSPHLIAPPQTIDPTYITRVGEELERYVFKDKDAMRPLAHLNVFMMAMVPDVQTVPVPVLAPVDTSRYLAEFARTGSLPREAAQSFLGSAITQMQFMAKTTGYDAILTVNPDLLRRHNIANVDLVQVHLGGTGMLYEHKGSGGASERGARVEDKDLRALYPDLRRHVSADGVTYNFIKYGVPYFANISCEREKWPIVNDVPCSQTDAILRAVLLDLRLIGGAPIALPRRAETGGPPRPTTVSPTFKFHAPGQLIHRNTSQGKLGGVTKKIRWAPGKFIFPLKEGPAFANSQLFMHGGDCFNEKTLLSGGRYKCRRNPTKILENRENHPENYDNPWFDTYCEVRNDRQREPKDCPAHKEAHEGQDIRPRECRSSNGHCAVDLFEVVAVTNGKALWMTPKNHLKLIANDGTGLYYMYMHMTPRALTAAGMRPGVLMPVDSGTKVGAVGNWLGKEGGTTAHLHFEIRDPRKQCGEFGCTSAPYWTLILAYELLINQRGTEITK